MEASQAFRFGGFFLNRASGRLEDANGCERFLRPKSYRVLELLCERRGELVSKDELIANAWPGVFVSDDSLAQCVSEIRQALGPDGRSLLRTVPRRGYMLEATDKAPRDFRKPVAVFRKALTAGMAASLLLVLGGDWSGWRHGGSFSTPDEAATGLRQAEALLDARDWRRREDNERARRLLERIVADNPGNARALAGLGLTYWLEVRHLSWGGGRREMKRALDLVERSVAIAGTDRSYRLLAEMRLVAPFGDLRSPVDALAGARAAVAIDPANPDNLIVLAQALALTGRAREAVEVVKRALRLSRDPPEWHLQVAGLSYLLAREPVHAADSLRPVYKSAAFTNVRWWPGWLLAASLAHAGRTEEAAGLVRIAIDRHPGYTAAAVAQTFDGLTDEGGLDLLLDGLRRAGMPG